MSVRRLCVLLLVGVWASSAARVWAQAPVDEGEAEAETAAPPEAVDPAIFDTALEDFYEQRYAEAAAGFWGYLKFGGAGAENYEWAQFFLAECLRSLELWHAAVQYYVIVAKTRSRPELLPQALGRLEAIAERRVFDEGMVFEELLYDSDFGALPAGLGAWVAYVQGLLNYRHDFTRWGERAFAGIDAHSPYALKAAYVKAVYALKKKQDEVAVGLLNDILASAVDDPDVKNKASLALARLHFDRGEFLEAERAYARVRQISLSFEQAELLVEKAWTAYALGELRQAMGYLHALEAPSYQRYFLPDAFVLRGIILKQLCHFIPAKRVVRAFRFRYGRALEQLHRRAALTSVTSVLDGATQDGPIARRTALIKQLEAERRLIDDYDAPWEEVGLDQHLASLYDYELKEQGRVWRDEFDVTADRVAKELLETDEQIALLDYEIGLDIFKRLKAATGRQSKEETLEVPYDSANVYYEFDTEFWNDELHSYQYFVTNRCFDAVEAP